MIKVPYEDMNFHYITSHYDLHWAGSCIYNGKIAEFITHDDTDYQTMNDTCPSCGLADGPDETCHCTAYEDVWCEIIELSFKERVMWFFRKHYYKLWFYLKYGYQSNYHY